MAQQVREHGLDTILRVPGAGDEADPVDVIASASLKLDAAMKEIAAAKEAAKNGEEEGRHATGEEIGKMGAEMGDALKAVVVSNDKATMERDRRLTLL